MKTAIHFKSQGQAIQGKFYSASAGSRPVPTLLLLSGFPGNEDDVLGLGETLSGHGLNVLIFNYRGIYQSEGDYSLANTQQDIQAAFDFLNDPETIRKFHIDPGRLLLGGWSYGGGMALTYAADHPQVKHIFSIAGTDHGEFAREYLRNKTFAKMVDEIFEEVKRPHGPVMFAGKTAIRKELIQDPDPYDLTSQAAKFTGRNLLLIGAWDDPHVVVEQHLLPVYRAFKKAGVENVTIKTFQDNHAFESSRPELVQTILNWAASQFIENPSP